MSRYNTRNKALNENELYRKKFESRDVKSILQYKTPILKFPTVGEEFTINVRSHIWRSTDRLYRLANKFYGDFRLWWVIAQYNKISSEANIELGSVIMIPYPLATVLQYVE